jgi:hypothetical protein
MDVDEKQITEFAYQIWQAEGEPEGQADRHWEMARKLAEAESSSPPVHLEGKLPTSSGVSGDPAAEVVTTIDDHRPLE